MSTSIQIPLDFRFRDEISLSKFYPGQNKNILTHLDQLADFSDNNNSSDRFLFFWGEPGCGKSHLLQAFCKQIHESGKSVSYFSCAQSGAQDNKIKPDMLEGLEQTDLITIDDIDLVAGNASWELALFTYIRKWQESSGILLLSSKIKPADIPFNLPDLKTRISGWSVVYQLHTLSDTDKLKVLRNYAETRGLKISHEVGQFILTRFPRNLKSMLELLEKADVAAMSQQRRLTIPFLKKLTKSD